MDVSVLSCDTIRARGKRCLPRFSRDRILHDAPTLPPWVPLSFSAAGMVVCSKRFTVHPLAPHYSRSQTLSSASLPVRKRCHVGGRARYGLTTCIRPALRVFGFVPITPQNTPDNRRFICDVLYGRWGSPFCAGEHASKCPCCSSSFRSRENLIGERTSALHLSQIQTPLNQTVSICCHST